MKEKNSNETQTNVLDQQHHKDDAQQRLSNEQTTVEFPNYLMAEQNVKRKGLTLTDRIEQKSLFDENFYDQPAYRMNHDTSNHKEQRQAQETMHVPKRRTIESEKTGASIKRVAKSTMSTRNKREIAQDLPVNKIPYLASEDERLAELTRMQEWKVDEPDQTFSATAQKTVFDEQVFRQQSASFDSQQARQAALNKKKKQNLMQEWRDHVHYSKHRPFNPTYLPSSEHVKGVSGHSDQTDYRLIKQTLLQAYQDLLLFEAKEEPLLDQETMTEIVQTKRNEKASQSLLDYTADRKRYMNTDMSTMRSEQVIQEVLLQELPTKQSLEPLASLNPLPGKQRRAMNRSLAWIMEQEKDAEYQATPYAAKQQRLQQKLQKDKLTSKDDQMKGIEDE